MIIHKLLVASISLLLLAGLFIGESVAQQNDPSLGTNVGSSQVAANNLNDNGQQCATIRSWDGATQRGGDLAVGGAGNLQYGDLKTKLLNNNVAILTGVAGGSLDAAALGAVDAFYWGVSSYILTGAEATALNNFIQNGGWLIVETDSGGSGNPETASANSAYNALGLGNRVLADAGVGFIPGAFLNVVTPTTVGQLGDLRLQSYLASTGPAIDATGHTLVGVSNVPHDTWVEFSVGSGGVLGVGDPMGFNLFSADNNDEAITNFILGNHCPQVVGGEMIPIDATMILVAGTHTAAAWMIPVIVSAIGIGIVIARKF